MELYSITISGKENYNKNITKNVQPTIAIRKLFIISLLEFISVLSNIILILFNKNKYFQEPTHIFMNITLIKDSLTKEV